MGASIHRVIVRGQFQDLDAEQRAALLAEVDEHEIFAAAYSEHGSFTYDAALSSFSLRYEVRQQDDDRDAGEVALGRARTQLDEWGLDHKHLRATATDMASMWEERA